jgi:lysophospholipase L1-like esterase
VLTLRRTAVLAALSVALAACGGSNGPSAPTPSPTPPGTSVTLVLFYDENANATVESIEAIRIPDVVVAVGARSARSEVPTGRAVVTGVQNGSYTASIHNDTLPPFYRPGAPININVPVADGTQVFVPVVLPIGSNTPNQYLAFGDSITKGEGDPGGGYPLRLQKKLTAHFGFANVRNRGADATNSYEALERLDRNLNKDAFGLILYGTNDWHIAGCQTDPAVCPTVENLRIVIQRVKAEGTLPFIATLTPANPAINNARNTWIAAINTGIKAMAAQEGAFVVDLYQAFQNQGGDLSRFFADDVHPNSAGYEVMAIAFFEAIAHGRSTP